ncbi:MAG: hypothetical protein DCC75_07025 [Proteobacteria bacterium]|nr:MAG: hypothetical protein DCC75_07025 [Pseudomonadota bacterium]
MKTYIILSFVTICFVACSVQVLADGQNSNSDWVQQAPKRAVSDAAFDKRLPPVFPGEEVSDGDKKIKVWSSSGPVPVGPAPEPFDGCSASGGLGCEGGRIPPGTGVIVDQRDDRRR